MRIALLLPLLTSLAFGQAMSPMPSVVPSGMGSPSGIFTCSAAVVTLATAAIYIQRDAPAGQALWICSLQQDGSTYAWIQRPSAVATADTGLIGGTSIVGLGCATGTVTIASAVTGVNAAIAVPLGDPGLISSLIPPTISATIGPSGVITVHICNAQSLVSFTPTALKYRVLVF